MKKYPLQDPSPTDMLLNYTIYPDIKLYSTFLYKLKDPKFRDGVQTGKRQIPRNRLTYIQPNKYLTISLEAERVLKHVYIDIEKLVNILETKGHYEPPGIVMRYWGPIYFKIRGNLPMKTGWVEEYKKSGKRYVSLFDLYFNYSSALPYTHPKFYDFFVVNRENIIDTSVNKGITYGGEVHLNHRDIEKKILRGDEKVILMINEGVGKWPVEYDLAWNSIYSRSVLAKYMDKNEFTKYQCQISPHFGDQNHIFDHSEVKATDQ
jgi:hypothetical protein